MKKNILYLCIIFVAILTMTSCSCSLENSNVMNDIQDSKLENSNATNDVQDFKYPIISLYVDYPAYATSDDIANAATNIYSGRIEDISFEIVDMRTGKADNSPTSPSTSRMLYTVYTISVTNSIKGDNPSEIKLGRVGGVIGYKEDTQYDKIMLAGLIDPYNNGIPVVTDKPSVLSIGTEYLFCTKRTVGDYDFPINLDQFAHAANSNEASAIIKSVEES